VSVGITIYAGDYDDGAPGTKTIVTTSRTYNLDDIVIVLYGNESSGAGDVAAITNSGTAQTWNSIANVAGNAEAHAAGWWCKMSTTQAMTMTCNITAGSAGDAGAIVIKCTGAHASDPIPAGKIFSGNGAASVSQSITPSDANGSALFLVVSDWNANDGVGNLTAATDCTRDQLHRSVGAWTHALYVPTTNPRPDGAAFTIGESGGTQIVNWIAFEVRAADASWTPQTNAPETLTVISAPRW
jgi:hypothetical protein